MRLPGLATLVGLLVLCPELTSASSPMRLCPSGEKPGKCPKPPPSGLCVQQCSADDACPGNLKCCFNGCGRTCQNPVLFVKPGACPKFKIPAGMPCVQKCCQDSDCQGRNKCCPQGCSNICFMAG